MTDAPVRTRPVRHLVLLAVTATTMTLVAGWTYATALLAILLAHESGHYLFCRRYRIDASLPYLLPGPPVLGTFGAFIRIRSPFPHRDALFDVGAAGPWAGFLVALPVLVLGLARSTIVESAPTPPFISFGDSLLTHALTRLVVGPIPDGGDVVLDPVAYAGWVGLLVTSLNLLPAGQLDGGHVLFAFGIRNRLVSLLPIPVLLVLAWQHWPGWLLWAVVLLVMTALGHPPTMDEARPLSRARRIAATLTLILFALTFVPEPMRLVR